MKMKRILLPAGLGNSRTWFTYSMVASYVYVFFVFLSLSLYLLSLLSVCLYVCDIRKVA